MPAAAVTIVEAAATLGVTGQTVRDWLASGAPCAFQGGVGRGRGSRVVVADLIAWRARQAGEMPDDRRALDHIAAGLADVFRNDAGEGFPLHRHLGIDERKAAALLVRAFEHVHRRLVGTDADQLPPEIQTLFGVCVESPHSRNPR